MNLTNCPLCRSICVIDPGLPPGNGHNYLNRCTASNLTGSLGRDGTHIVRPTHRGNGICGFPLTTKDGNPIPELDYATYHSIISTGSFSVKELRAAVWKHAHHVLDGPAA